MKRINGCTRSRDECHRQILAYKIDSTYRRNHTTYFTLANGREGSYSKTPPHAHSRITLNDFQVYTLYIADIYTHIHSLSNIEKNINFSYVCVTTGKCRWATLRFIRLMLEVLTTFRKKTPQHKRRLLK